MPHIGILAFFKRKITPSREARQRAAMAAMGLDVHEQDAAFKLMNVIERGLPQERKDALAALRLLVESGRLRQG